MVGFYLTYADFDVSCPNCIFVQVYFFFFLCQWQVVCVHGLNRYEHVKLGRLLMVRKFFRGVYLVLVLTAEQVILMSEFRLTLFGTHILGPCHTVPGVQIINPYRIHFPGSAHKQSEQSGFILPLKTSSYTAHREHPRSYIRRSLTGKRCAVRIY